MGEALWRLQPGRHDDVPLDAYHADPAISSSGARRLLQTCPERFRYEQEHGRKRSAARDLGQVAHLYLFEPERALAGVHVAPDDWRTPEGKADKPARDAAEAAGKAIIRESDLGRLEAMAERIGRHPLAAMLSPDVSDFEVTLVADDPAHGIRRRARPDVLPRNPLHIIDYKTCESVATADIEKSVSTYGYHCQAAWYFGLIQAVTGVAPRTFVLLMQEKEPPHIVRAVPISEDAIAWGRRENAKAMRIYAECLSSGIWPDYGEDMTPVGLTRWKEIQLQAECDAGNLPAPEAAPITSPEYFTP